jgi:hypothetical protein
MAIERALPSCFDRRVAQVPDRGVLIVATDLQGNHRDYHALKQVYFAEKAAGNDPILVLCGDLVHGPHPAMNLPGAWPDYLGTPYVDESARLLIDFERFTRTERAFAVLGNHEHAHIGGPVVPKFHPDEAAVLDRALGPDRERMHAFLRTWPLIAPTSCGAALLHGAPGATAPDRAAFEQLTYAGYEHVRINDMYRHDVLGALLWCRMARPEQAQAFLAAVGFDAPQTFAAFGHDVVREGWECTGAEQICFSTSYGLFDERKVYLRLDLSARYADVTALRVGHEIRHLYPSSELGDAERLTP